MLSHIEKWKKDEAEADSMQGWDFSYVADRIIREDPPWSYLELAHDLVSKSKNCLDMGTGGGEIFSSLAPFGGRAVATESHPSILPVARKNLEPLGVNVVDTSKVEHGQLPFSDEEFDLVLNRHEFFKPKEVFRILKSGGMFLTQQVCGEDTADLATEFHAVSRWPDWNIQTATKKVYEAGFAIERSEKWIGKIIFKDVGAIVYWLRAIPWKVENFSVDNYQKVLEGLQKKLDSGQELAYVEERFLIIAKKP
jgi:ubiquinone/menaquinone biosynthesis C-methylase UbiE